MIVFDLKCSPVGHVFEAWFGSGADFDSQKERGLVLCPLCNSPDVAKAAMAPRIGGPADAEGEDGRCEGDSRPDQIKAMLATMTALQKAMLARSHYVGERFADEARAIHLGEAAARSIYGKATGAETESLREEGIDVAPLPFPVILPGEEN